MSNRVTRVALAASAIMVVAPLLATTSAVAAPAGDVQIRTNDRESVIHSYRQNLEPLLDVPVGWTGSTKECRPGTTTKDSRQATLAAVNYVRSLAGLPSVTLNAGKSDKAQSAALIMAANGYLSHQPTRSASCWSQKGYDGASHGNLFLGWGYGAEDLSDATGPRAVVGYMDDPGDSNVLVGHRRWILYQQQKSIGTGDTDVSNALYVIGNDKRPSANKWVSWPTAGYFPKELEPDGRWSLSYPGADFSRAKVTASTPEGSVKVRQYPVANGYGDNTLSWDMSLPGAYAPQDNGWSDPFNESTGASGPLDDLPVTVKVSGIRVGGKPVTKTWTTTLVQAETPANPPVETPGPGTAGTEGGSPALRPVG